MEGAETVDVIVRASKMIPHSLRLSQRPCYKAAIREKCIVCLICPKVISFPAWLEMPLSAVTIDHVMSGPRTFLPKLDLDQWRQFRAE